MVEIGTEVGRKTAALISDMDQPLGFAIGNALEVQEAIDTLHGRGPDDLTKLCLALSAHMVVLGGKADSLAEAELLLRDKLASGEALDKFRALVAAQGGNPAVADDTSLLPQAPVVIPVIAEHDGYVQRIDAEQLGIAAMVLGAGRATKDAVIDYAVGLTLRLKVGDRVRRVIHLCWFMRKVKETSYLRSQRGSSKLIRSVNRSHPLHHCYYRS